MKIFLRTVSESSPRSRPDMFQPATVAPPAKPPRRKSGNPQSWRTDLGPRVCREPSGLRAPSHRPRCLDGPQYFRSPADVDVDRLPTRSRSRLAGSKCRARAHDLVCPTGNLGPGSGSERAREGAEELLAQCRGKRQTPNSFRFNSSKVIDEGATARSSQRPRRASKAQRGPELPPGGLVPRGNGAAPPAHRTAAQTQPGPIGQDKR